MALQPTQSSETAADRRRSHLKEVTSEPAPDSLGAMLRAARVKIGEDLKNVGRVTKIKPDYLEALEDGRFDALPGRAYAIGFLRSYATFLGLDPKVCIDRLKVEYLDGKPVDPSLSMGLPEIEEEVRVPPSVLILGAVTLVGLVYGGIYLFRSASDYMEQRAHPAPSEAVETVGPAAPAPDLTMPTPAVTGLPTQTDPSATVSTLQPGGLSTAPTTANATSVPAGAPLTLPNTTQAPVPGALSSQPGIETKPVLSATQPAVSQPTANIEGATDRAAYDRAVAGAPRSFGVASKDNRVVLRAKEQVFVRVEAEGPRNRVLFEDTLSPGDVYYVPPGANIVLVTRNGGALDLFVDGAAKGSAGPAGIALKGLSLDANNLKARP